MKKVLLFLDYYENGGIESIISSIRNNLGDKYKIDILSFVNCSTDKDVKSLIKKIITNFFIRNIVGLIKLKKYIKTTKYDIVHINCYNSFGLIYAKIFKKYINKVIVHSHNSGIDNDFFKIKNITNSLIKLIYKKNYVLIGCSKETNIFCFGKEFKVIPNGVEYNKYLFNDNNRNKYRKMFNLNDKIVIGCIGRFTKQKNQAFIINIFYKLLQENDKYFLVLIGNGKYLNRCRKMVKKLNIEDNVMIFKTRNDIDKMINMFDIYVQPSLYEGLSLTIIENQINNRYVLISNKVTEDSIISNNAHRLPLKQDLWIKHIKNIKKSTLNLDYKLDIDKFIASIDNIYK